MLASADRVAATSTSVQVGASGDILTLSQPIMRAEDRGFDAADLIGFQLRPLRGCERPFAEIEIACRSTGGFTFTAGGGGSGYNRPLSWSIDAQGRLIFIRYGSNGTITQRRVWERVAEVGDTLFVLEQVEYPPLPDLDTAKPAGLMAYRKIPLDRSRFGKRREFTDFAIPARIDLTRADAFDETLASSGLLRRV